MIDFKNLVENNLQELSEQELIEMNGGSVTLATIAAGY